LCHPLGELGVTYTVHPWLVGKRVVDFLIVLIELFLQLLRLMRYELILVEIVLFESGWVTLSANFMDKGGGVVHQRIFVKELESLGYHVVLFA